MPAGPSEVKGRRKVMYICGTPFDVCRGGFPDTKTKCKFHSSPEQVRSCNIQYLLSLGYKKSGPRCFDPPNGGPTLVLSKNPERAKPGKGGRYMGKSNTKKFKCM